MLKGQNLLSVRRNKQFSLLCLLGRLNLLEFTWLLQYRPQSILRSLNLLHPSRNNQLSPQYPLNSLKL
jgi:hypothetical protein